MPQLDLTTYTVQVSELLCCWLFFYLILWSCRIFKFYFFLTLRRFLLKGAYNFFFVRTKFFPSRSVLTTLVTRQRAVDTLIVPRMWRPAIYIFK